MPTLEKWLLATVIALLVGAWHAAAALRGRAARKSLPPRPAADAVAGEPPARLGGCRRWPAAAGNPSPKNKEDR